MLRHRLPFAFMLAAASLAHAQWAVGTLHPMGADKSAAFSGTGVQLVGSALVASSANSEYHDHASVWNAAEYTWVNLHPAGATRSVAYAISGPRQAGFATFAGRPHAGLWTGTAGSWVDVQPAGAAESVIYAMAGTQQAGYAQFSTRNHAGIWNGTAASWIDLHPAGATSSVAYGVSGTQQVGSATYSDGTHAGLWSGTAGSLIDLGRGAAYATSGTQQVGYALVGPTQVRHAALWSGSPGSLIDLNPPGATSSVAYGLHGNFQVGTATYPDGTNLAGVWRGTAASWQPLPFPGNEPYTAYHPNVCRNIWIEGNRLCASGHLARAGYFAVLWNDRAIFWSRPLTPTCGTQDFNGDGDSGTDADIEAFFACLAGNCCATCWHGGQDFNGDGDSGTDQDIEAFFRVLAGGSC
jgi:hypothetical protein